MNLENINLKLNSINEIWGGESNVKIIELDDLKKIYVVSIFYILHGKKKITFRTLSSYLRKIHILIYKLIIPIVIFYMQYKK